MPTLTMANRLGALEWDAACYHRICQPQMCWGLKVIERLAINGNETVMDAGCGSGRLTAALLDRLSSGKILAVDRSEAMLRTARMHLGQRYNGRVTYFLADLQSLPVAEAVDLVFSAATFHWITDHQRLFSTMLQVLKPGGRLVAQCGGGANIARLRRRLEALSTNPPYTEFFADWSDPWLFAWQGRTVAHLRAAGFVDVEVSLVPAPFQFATAADYREFVAVVLLRAHLARIPTPELRHDFLEDLTEQAARDNPPFRLDFWRLNLQARRPLALRTRMAKTTADGLQLHPVGSIGRAASVS